MKRSDSLIQVFCLLSVALGVGLGFLLRFTVGPTSALKGWIQIPGNILLNVLKMFSLPLIVTSVLAGVTGLHTKMSRKAGLITGAFVCGSTLYAAAYGLSLVITIRPGVGSELGVDEEDTIVPFSMNLIFMDILRNMFPESFIQAFFEQYKTEVVYLSKDQIVIPMPQNDSEMLLVGSYIPEANIIGLIFWSFTIGILLIRVGDNAKSTLKLIQIINESVKIIVIWFLWYLPIGVFFLITDSVLVVEDWGDAFKLVKFAGVVCMAHGCYAFIILPTFFFLLVRRNPIHIYRKISKAMMTAFIISSSTATLPIALQCCEENVKVNKKLLRLILPITVGINMNGTTLYEVIASIFITQINDIKLDISQIIAICLCSAFVTFGTAGVPAKGAVTTIMVLTSVGLPAKDAVHLVVFEWLLDHFTTMVNILTNMMGVIVIHFLWEADMLALEERQRTDKVRSNNDLELDLTCLEPDDDLIPSASSPSGSISPK